MSPPPNPPNEIEIVVRTSHPQLLAGLDAWLHLGLLSEAQVKKLSSKYLVCRLPEPAAEPSFSLIPQTTSPALSATNTPNPQTVSPPTPNFLTSVLHSLMAELSVVWLLFLGVFLVVISSGVLAASQWQRFPAAGQYGVLLGYTLTFWGISGWASKQRNLQLTGQTLQLVTLLLVPINFWAMDTFGLWRYPLDWPVALAAAGILTFITWKLLQDRSENLPATSTARLSTINHLALSYLHSGWGWSGAALIAVYLGTISTVIITFYQTRQHQIPHREEEVVSQSSALKRDFLPSKKVTLVVYALAILLGRAIFVKSVEISEIGLALGICGALLAWLDQQQQDNSSSQPTPAKLFNWETIGGGLLGLGWLVSVDKVPGQALAVSGLALWFFGSRLTRFWRKVDLAILFAIALQAIWLFWRLIPFEVKTQALVILTQITRSQEHPWALLSIALFPYLILTVSFTQWLYRQQQPRLAGFGEAIALIFGMSLTIISAINPLLRTLNLLGFSLTLAWVTWQYITAATPDSPLSNLDTSFRVYLTHIIGLATIFSAIDWFFPSLNQSAWAAILLLIMLVEWILFVNFNTQQQRENNSSFRLPPSAVKSSWNLGLALAGTSFVLLTNSCWLLEINSPKYLDSCLLWLVTPIALTAVAKYTDSLSGRLATKLSAIALVIAQTLTIILPGNRLISLGVATGLMLVNTQYLPQLPLAVITLGFSLSLCGALLWEGMLGFPKESPSAWLIASGIAILSLWLIRHWLNRSAGEIQQENNQLPIKQIYAQAADGWAIALTCTLLTIISIHSWGLYGKIASINFYTSTSAIITIIIIIAAIAYRSYQQFSPWAVYGLAWALELLTAEILGFTGSQTVHLAIANIALGLATQLLGDFWRNRAQNPDNFPSIHIIPLLYGVLGVILRSHTFTSWTGLTSLGISLIAIGIGRRKPEFKTLVYLGIIGISISSYELVIYQLSKSSGGALGDGLIILATLGTSIMYAYRLLSPWLINYFLLTPQELKIVAHIHWVWSSLLLVSASAYPIESAMLLGLGTGIFLVQYAIFQGRRHPQLHWGENWVYIGFIEAFAIRLYWLNTPVARFIAGPLFLWKAAIASVFAYLIYILPWETWGWSKKPWKVAAFLIPIIAIAESQNNFHPLSLLIAAAFYIFLAWDNQQLRFTYISALLIDWVILRWFDRIGLTQPELYVTPLGFTLLYIAQVDPALKLPDQKDNRHLLRMLGSSLICGVALLTQHGNGLVPGMFSLAAIFTGLALRVRAFLLVGSTIFLINAFYQLVILIFDYPFIKWVIGLGFGIIFIWIAATFETRRDRITSLVQHWITQLQTWE
ncbi:MAG TPA: hypothetical protein VK211_27800 [Kamptonema sp.]|nr:hypothetical protein [Kamptonema sp.]